jgi:hypothetical protein
MERKTCLNGIIGGYNGLMSEREEELNKTIIQVNREPSEVKTLRKILMIK